MRRARSKVLSVCLLGAAVLTACGGGGGGGGGSKGVTPQAYTSTVCSALKTYVNDLQGFSTSVSTAVGANSSPENAKAQLQKFVGDLLTSTDTLISQIKGAGTPDVTNGAQVTTTLVSAFEQTKTGIESLRSEIDNLPTDLQGFTTGAQAISTAMTNVFNSAGNSLGTLQVPELQAAANANPTCKSLAN
jgi:hypothetical protein